MRMVRLMADLLGSSGSVGVQREAPSETAAATPPPWRPHRRRLPGRDRRGRRRRGGGCDRHGGRGRRHRHRDRAGGRGQRPASHDAARTAPGRRPLPRPRGYRRPRRRGDGRRGRPRGCGYQGRSVRACPWMLAGGSREREARRDRDDHDRHERPGRYASSPRGSARDRSGKAPRRSRRARLQPLGWR